MGFSWMDFMKIAAPIGVAMIPGVGIPASIALGAAMQGGMSAAEGGSTKEILRDTLLGGASGAGGAAVAGGISKGLTGAGTKMAEGAGAKALATMATESVPKGMEQFAKQTARGAMLQKLGTATSGALGKNADKTADILEMVQKGGKIVGAADMAVNTYDQMQTPTFTQQHMAMAQQAGLPEDLLAQFGGGGGFGMTPTVGSRPNRFGSFGGY